MWIAVNVTDEGLSATYNYLLAALMSEVPAPYQAAFQWSLFPDHSSSSSYELAEIVCHTTRSQAPARTQQFLRSPLQFAHTDGEHIISITQSAQGLLRDYFRDLHHNGKRLQYEDYESFQGSKEELDHNLSVVYPKILLDPVDLTGYITALAADGVLAKLIKEDGAGVEHYPANVYVMHVAELSATVLDELKLFGSVTTLPELTLEQEKEQGSCPIRRLSEELVEVEQDSCSPHSSIIKPVSPSRPLNSNVTLVTPKGSRTRRASSTGHPGKHHRVYYNDYDSRSVDPLEDEQWQEVVSRRLEWGGKDTAE